MTVFGTNVHLSLTISHLTKNKLEEKVLVTKNQNKPEKKRPPTVVVVTASKVLCLTQQILISQ